MMGSWGFWIPMKSWIVTIERHSFGTGVSAPMKLQVLHRPIPKCLRNEVRTVDYRTIMGMVKVCARRNHIILSDLNKAAKVNTVNLHWWKLPGMQQNVGDMLSPVVVEYLLKKNNIRYAAPISRTCHLYAIGSIIDGGYQDAVVWGSGLLRGKDHYWWHKFRRLDIRAVRGPLTRQAMLDNGYECPEVYGDPAILMSLCYQPEDREKKYAFRVVPHMVYGSAYPNFLSPYTESWKNFIDGMVQSELIISSSLHGIILAEAYGIPAVLLNDHDMNLFKYKDYYFSTGRYEFPVAKSVEEALSMTPARIPDFESIQMKLIEVFPVDLWAESMMIKG